MFQQFLYLSPNYELASASRASRLSDIYLSFLYYHTSVIFV